MSRKPGRKSKKFSVSDGQRSKKKSTKEDFVGKFLLSIFTVLVTVLSGLAVANQLSWLVVVLVCLLGLAVLAIYQNRK